MASSLTQRVGRRLFKYRPVKLVVVGCAYAKRTYAILIPTVKKFSEALRDGYNHIREITDPVFLRKMREEGIRIDDEGYYTYSFGEAKEYELRIEPVGNEGQYQIALYKLDVLLTEKLIIWKDKQTAN